MDHCLDWLHTLLRVVQPGRLGRPVVAVALLPSEKRGNASMLYVGAIAAGSTLGMMTSHSTNLIGRFGLQIDSTG